MNSEGYKNKIVEDFKIYITGMYILQQEFINDIEGGLQAVLENYIIRHNSDSSVENVKKNSIVKDNNVAKEQKIVQEDLVVKEDHDVQKEQEKNVLQEVGVLNHESVKEEIVSHNESVVPQSVIDRINEISLPQEKKTKKSKKEDKPKKEKKEKDDKPRKKKALSPYNVFMKHFSEKNPGIPKDERMGRLSEEWEVVKNDPEKLSYFVKITEEQNLKNDQAYNESITEQ